MRSLVPKRGAFERLERRTLELRSYPARMCWRRPRRSKGQAPHHQRLAWRGAIWCVASVRVPPPSAPAPAIALQGLVKRFASARGRPPTVAVDGIDLHVAAGELLVLLGGSGSGKSTTLRMINRLIEPTEGSIHIEGVDAHSMAAPELRRRIGYVFQRVGLFPHMNVAQNIAVTPKLLGWPAERIEAQVDAMLHLVELEPHQYRSRLPSALSGGQQQRVGVARALAAEPRIMLLDEPFGALDPETRETVQDRFIEIRKRLSLSAVFVTHDMAEAFLLADRIAIMRDGKVVQHGRPKQLLEQPADEQVKAMVETPFRQSHRLEQLLG